MTTPFLSVTNSSGSAARTRPPETFSEITVEQFATDSVVMAMSLACTKFQVKMSSVCGLRTWRLWLGLRWSKLRRRLNPLTVVPLTVAPLTVGRQTGSFPVTLKERARARSFFYGLTTVLLLLERKLTFKPTGEDHGGFNDLPHQRFEFGHEFGLRLDGVFVDNGSTSVVLFTHGNRHNITRFREHYHLFTSIGQSFFTFDYPGYGKSPGTPSEKIVYASARAAHSFINKTLDFQPHHIVSYGCSMGGAVAIELAQHAPIACLITESTFTNTWEMAKHLYPYLPIWPLLPKRFRNDEKVGRIRVPILMIHGEDDLTVPASMAQTLYGSARDPKELVLVPGADHINSLDQGGEKLKETIRDFIVKHTAC